MPDTTFAQELNGAVAAGFIVPDWLSRGQSRQLPIVHDDFDRPDGTLNGTASTTGQVWQISGPGASAAELRDGALYGSETAAASNFYASLDYGQQITFQSAIVRFESRGTDPQTVTSLGPQVVIIPQTATRALSDMLHFQIFRTAWSIQIRTGGGTFDNFGGSGSYDMRPDTDYVAGIQIDKANSRCRVFISGPGVRVDSGWLSESRIATLDLTSATYQIQSVSATDAFRPSYRAVTVGPPKKGGQRLFNMLFGHQTEVRAFGGRGGRVDVPRFIMNQASAYYRVLEHATLSGNSIQGVLHINASSSVGASRSSWLIYAKNGALLRCDQLSHAGDVMFRAIRLSTESTGAAIDIQASTSAASFPITMDLWFEGGATPGGFGLPKYGVNALTGQSTDFTVANAAATSAVGTASANGWYSVASSTTSGSGGFSIHDTFEIVGRRNDGAALIRIIATVSANAGTSLGATPITVLSVIGGNTSIANALRVSRETGVGVRVDLNCPGATSAPLTITVRRIGGAAYSTLGPVAAQAATLVTETVQLDLVQDAIIAPTLGTPLSRRTSFLALADGGSTTIPANVGRLFNTTTATIASHTIVLPTGVYDGREVIVATRGEITALTVTPASGNSIVGAPTTLPASGRTTLIFQQANSTWYQA